MSHVIESGKYIAGEFITVNGVECPIKEFTVLDGRVTAITEKGMIAVHKLIEESEVMEKHRSNGNSSS